MWLTHGHLEEQKIFLDQSYGTKFKRKLDNYPHQGIWNYIKHEKLRLTSFCG